MPSTNNEQIQLWRDSHLLGGLDILKARCRKHHYPSHTHDTFVIASFKNGAQKHKIAQKFGVAYPGSVMIIPPGEVHSGEGAKRLEEWEYVAFYPSVDCLTEIADGLFGGNRGSLDFGTSFLIEDNELSDKLIKACEISHHSNCSLTRQEAVYSAFETLITRYGKRSGQTATNTMAMAPIQRSLEYMEENFSQPLYMEDIAEQVGLSQYYFMRQFKAQTQMTVHKHLKQLRLNSAKKLLTNGMSISDAAVEVGFYDQSHFTNSFRQVFGVTPKSYVRACR